MTSSGMKRGLAVTAVSALAVTGLPFLTATASADSLADQGTAGTVELFSQQSNHASVKNDGQNTTVHLLAGGGAGVEQVRFEYQVGSATPVVIGAPVSRSNGAFSLEWSPAASLYGLDVIVRAVGLNSVGGEIGGAGTAENSTVLVNAAEESVDISNAPGSSIGYFEQPYALPDNESLAVVSGTTSNVGVAPSITLEELSDAATGGANTVATADLGEPAGGVRSFKGTVDLSGYSLDTTDPISNQVVIGAQSGSDDAEALTVYEQEITTVTATANSTNVPSGTDAQVTVKVTDQNGKPIAGAQVVPDDSALGAQYTGVNGTTVFSASGSTGGTAHTYTVNTTGNSAYEPGTDFRRTVTVTSYAAVAQSITGTPSKLGSALDTDEYAANPLSILVKDQNGNPAGGQSVSYSWSVDLFDDGAPQPPAQTGSVATAADGTANIPAPALGDGAYTLNTFIERDGNPGQTAGDLQMSPMNVKVGEADVVFDDGDIKQAQTGTTTMVSGKLQLADGTALTARDASLGWAPNGDAILAPQASQPSGTTRVSNTSATTKTGSDGKFSVAIVDPAAATPANEIGGDLTATPTNNADAASSVEVDFLRYMQPADIGDISIDDEGLFGLRTPGRPVDLDITVVNADGYALTDLPVNVSVDKGFLSPDSEVKDDLVPDPAAAEGGLYGEWKSDGTTESLVTDDDGKTGIVAAIEKDAGFDTDNDVTLTVSVKAGGVTDTEPLVFTSQDAMNPGKVSVQLAAHQTVRVLPNAPTSESVYYDVLTTDQFGNIVAGEPVEISDGGSPGKLNTADGAITATSQLKGDNPAVVATSTSATAQTLAADWETNGTRTWTDGDLTTPGFQEETPGGADSVKLVNPTTESDTANALNWYLINFAGSHYTLGSGDNTRTVGDTVHTTFKGIDQMGEPISSLSVKFFRTGPDNLQDGDGKDPIWTDEDGTATYIWQGAKAGKAVVTSVVRRGDTNALIPQAELTDGTTFAPARRDIDASLFLRNQRDGDDVVQVNAPSAAHGATVRLYKVAKTGKHTMIATKKANKYGNGNFVVNDRRKRSYTKYVAHVSQTARTLADWTVKRRIR